MFALAYLFFLLLYVALSVVVVIAVGRWASRRGKTRWKWTLGAAGVMWLIVFWDWIPTVLLHRHLCNTWAGVTIYKTPEQWLAENRDKPRNPLLDAASLKKRDDMFVVALAGERFAVTSVTQWYVPLPVNADTKAIVDRTDATVLAERRTVDAGNPKPGMFGDWRRYLFWLDLDECAPESELYFRYGSRVRELAKELR